MRSTIKAAAALFLAFIMTALAACTTGDDTVQSYTPVVDLNETQTLVVGIEESGDNINPLFLTTKGASDIAETMNSRLLMNDATGVPVTGEDWPTVAEEYTVNFVNDADEVHTEYVEGDRALYTFIIKKNLRFSDGTDLTADDVLFTMYTLLDPLYDGSLGFSSLPIEGVSEYTSQMTPEIEEEYTALAEEFLENGEDYTYEPEEGEENLSQTLSDAFWQEIIPLAGEEYCSAAVDYVCANYLTDEYVARYLSADLTAQAVSESETLKIAYAMIVWEVGAFNEEGRFELSERAVDIANGEELTLKDFWQELYADENGDISSIDDDAAGENTVSALAVRRFVAQYGPQALSEKITEVSGLGKGEMLIDGVVYETVQLILSDYDPSYLSQMMIPVVSRVAYTDGYTYAQDARVSFGVPLNNEAFMAHIKAQTQPTVGSGAYKSSVGPMGGFHEDGAWYLQRNDFFETLGGTAVHNASIKNLCFVTVSAGEEYSDLEGGFFSVATFTPDAETAVKLSENENIGTISVPYNSYGYICINPRYYPDINERIALSMLMDTSLALEYYPSNTASSLYRSYSKASFVYPEATVSLYPYDAGNTSVKEYFEEAGYEFEENEDGTVKMIDSTSGEQAKFTLTLPATSDSHPAGAVFERAVSRLNALGAIAEIAVDENLVENVRSDMGVGIYAMGRNLGDDPDMRRTYDYTAANDSTRANGITWLWENGASSDMGTVSVNGTEYTQEYALEHLSELLNDAAYETDIDSRAEYYHEALNLLAKLDIEIPLYQRNTMFVYDAAVLDASSLNVVNSSFYTPMQQLWKLRFEG